MPTAILRDTGALERWLSAELAGRFDAVLTEAIPDELLALAGDDAED